MAIALILGLFAASIGGILGIRDLRGDYVTHYVHPDPASGSHEHSDPLCLMIRIPHLMTHIRLVNQVVNGLAKAPNSVINRRSQCCYL